MAWYLVSYDLRRELSPADWKAMHTALRSASDYCWPLQSVWIIQTPLKPSDIINRLVTASVLDDNDGIIVLEITGIGSYRRVVNQETADWLNSHLTHL